MLHNPFTPSEIASSPDDFFGRDMEMKTLERSLNQGSVAIQGAIGIGKSSLLARARLKMEGFDSNHQSKSVIAVCNKDIQTIDEMARVVLESFVSIDEKQKKVKFKIGNLFETESAEITKYFSEGRHLSILKRIVEKDYLNNYIDANNLLILAIDEADKSPIPLARFFRSLITHTQQQGVKNLRFILSGVHPFYQEMIGEDSGIARFIYKTINLLPLPPEESAELLEAKFSFVAEDARKLGIDLRIDPNIITRIVKLSGGHPHIIQLLGSHIIEHECENPDEIINTNDLINSLQKICFEDRARVYEDIFHRLDINDMTEPFYKIIYRIPRGFPSRISRGLALEYAEPDQLEWLVDQNIISIQDGYYSLVDEFLRVRIILDQENYEASELEKQILKIEDLNSDDYLYEQFN
jgi:hypothetical protein